MPSDTSIARAVVARTIASASPYQLLQNPVVRCAGPNGGCALQPPASFDGSPNQSVFMCASNDDTGFGGDPGGEYVAGFTTPNTSVKRGYVVVSRNASSSATLRRARLSRSQVER